MGNVRNLMKKLTLLCKGCRGKYISICICSMSINVTKDKDNTNCAVSG